MTDDAVRAIDSLPSAVALLDANGYVVHANPAARRVLGWDANAVVGLAPRRLRYLAGAPVPKSESCVGCPGSDVGDQKCAPIERPNGEKVCLGFRVNDVGPSAELPWRYAVTLRDLRDWRKLRDERDRLMQLAAVGNALPAILHELKNPLAAITANVELLIEESADPSLQRDLHAVLSEMRRLALGLEGIGAVGRTLRGSRNGVVDEALRDVCAVMGRRAAGYGIELRTDVADLPLLPFDPAVLRAMLFNLLTNALHACSRGSTIVVHARLADARTALEISVVDTGCGMTQEVYDRCTELFFTTKRSGSGIGLALCHQAVTGAGGTIDIQSVPGFGTNVTLRIPLQVPVTTENPIARAQQGHRS